MSLTKEIIDRDEVFCFAPVGGSMYPFIRSRDVIHIKPAHRASLRYGDIILFCDEKGGLLAHRIIKKRKTGDRSAFFVKGDALAGDDGYIEREAIIGKVVAIEKGKRLIDLDGGLFKLANILYTLTLPVSRWAYVLFERCAKKIY